MTEAAVSFVGNLTDDPEVRSTQDGIARAVFRVAVSGRREQEASFFTVVVWRDQAEHAVQSLAKGSRVVVVGRLQQRSWTGEDGSARSVVEVVAKELGRVCAGRRPRRPGSPRTVAPSDSWWSLSHPLMAPPWTVDFQERCVAFRTRGIRGTSRLRGCAAAANGAGRCDTARAWPSWPPCG
jgi:single-strand DNA-binding protein